MLSHAQEQAVARYGQSFKLHRLLEKIKEGKATLLPWGKPGKPVYDVPYRNRSNEDIIVRCVVNQELTRVITVLPVMNRKSFYRKLRNTVLPQAGDPPWKTE